MDIIKNIIKDSENKNITDENIVFMIARFGLVSFILNIFLVSHPMYFVTDKLKRT